MEDNDVISDDKDFPEIFNDNHMGSKDVGMTELNLLSTDSIDYQIGIAITKYNYHLSVIRMKTNFNRSRNFQFTSVPIEDLYKRLKRCNPRKATQLGSILVKILKERLEIFNTFNLRLAENYFPKEPKNRGNSSLYKKGKMP